MSNSGKQAFCGEEGNTTPLKTTAWEARGRFAVSPKKKLLSMQVRLFKKDNKRLTSMPFTS